MIYYTNQLYSHLSTNYVCLFNLSLATYDGIRVDPTECSIGGTNQNQPKQRKTANHNPVEK